MSLGLILLIIIGALALILIAIYNSLVRSRVRVNEAWSDITVQMKRRLDLIPNLVKTVKSYAKHEKGTFESVTKARAEAISASNIKEAAEAENHFEKALKSLFAVAENYPDLKANQNYLQLQDELSDTENKIQAARRFYNGSVRDFNSKLQVFPTNIIGKMLGFKPRDFFEVEEGEAEATAKPVEVDI